MATHCRNDGWKTGAYPLKLVFADDPEPKRRAILAAASDLFLHRGFRATPMAAIAEKAGVAKGTLYLYFTDKDALFRALIAAFEADIDRAADAARHLDAAPHARLVAMLDAKYGFAMRLMHRAPHAAEMMQATTTLAADRLRNFSSGYRHTLQTLLATLLPDPAQAPDVTRALCAACDGIATTANSPEDFADLLGAQIGRAHV